MALTDIERGFNQFPGGPGLATHLARDNKRHIQRVNSNIYQDMANEYLWVDLDQTAPFIQKNGYFKMYSCVRLPVSCAYDTPGDQGTKLRFPAAEPGASPYNFFLQVPWITNMDPAGYDCWDEYTWETSYSGGYLTLLVKRNGTLIFRGYSNRLINSTIEMAAHLNNVFFVDSQGNEFPATSTSFPSYIQIDISLGTDPNSGTFDYNMGYKSLLDVSNTNKFYAAINMGCDDMSALEKLVIHPIIMNRSPRTLWGSTEAEWKYYGKGSLEQLDYMRYINAYGPLEPMIVENVLDNPRIHNVDDYEIYTTGVFDTMGAHAIGFWLSDVRCAVDFASLNPWIAVQCYAL